MQLEQEKSYLAYASLSLFIIIHFIKGSLLSVVVFVGTFNQSIHGFFLIIATLFDKKIIHLLSNSSTQYLYFFRTQDHQPSHIDQKFKKCPKGLSIAQFYGRIFSIVAPSSLMISACIKLTQNQPGQYVTSFLTRHFQTFLQNRFEDTNFNMTVLAPRSVVLIPLISLHLTQITQKQ